MFQRTVPFIFAIFTATLLTAQPVITSFSPVAAPAGTNITITGSGFSSVTSDNIVYFGAVRATIVSSSSTSIVATVPAAATNAPISVTYNNLTAWSHRPFILTFSAGGAISTLSFGTPQGIDSSGLPSNPDIKGLSVSDFNDDGKPDIAIADRTNNRVFVYSNLSTTTILKFSTKLELTTGARPIFVAAGDIDNDGKQDLLVANSEGATVSIYKNTSAGGTISFAAPVSINAGTQPTAIAVSDLNNDGKADLAIANTSFNGVSILRNTSTTSISFAPPVTINAPGSYNSVSATDLNGDKKQDLVFCNFMMNSIVVLRNASDAGNLSFGSPQSFPVGSFPSAVAAGDIDGDGKPDLAVANFGSNTVSVFRNTTGAGTISFHPKFDISNLNSPDNVMLSDMDGDGRVDLLANTANDPSTYTYSVLKNTSVPLSITFGNAVHKNVPGDQGIAAADMNGDGKADVVVSGGYYKSMVALNNIEVPAIASFNPQTAGQNDTVTIYGIGFQQVTAVTFGGIAAQSFTIENGTTIKAIVNNGTSGSVEVTSSQGTSALPGFIFPAPPAISSFTPAAAGEDAVVTINGSNFSGASSVTFGGLPAKSFTIVSPAKITAVVATGNTGLVAVTTTYGTGSLTGFVYVNKPVINSVTPAIAGPGAAITIRGSYFTNTSAVSFGGVAASSFNVVSDTEITAIVGQGATGNVAVTTPGGTGVFSSFKHLSPVITSFSPVAVGTGGTVTLKGTSFTGVTAVSFGGTAATSFTVTSDSTITAVVSTGTTGNVTVTNPYGTSSVPGFVHTSFPYITSFSPASGQVGTVVTIHGVNFNPVAANNLVHFGPVKAKIISATSTQLVVKVPVGANFEKITVTTGNRIASSTTPFRVTFDNGSISSASFTGRLDLTTPANNNILKPFTKDLDGDGRPDIGTFNVMNDNSARYFTVFQNRSNNGTLSMASPLNISFPFDVADVSLSDLDADGKADMIVGRETVKELMIYRNTSIPGVVSFATPVKLIISHFPLRLESYDVDLDGRNDIVMNNMVNAGAVYPNTSTGAGIFSLGTPVNISYLHDRPHSLSFDDLDGDRKQELIVTHYNTMGSVVVYRNLSTPGNVALAPGVTLEAAIGNSTYTIPVDFDGNGKTDLVTVNNNVPGYISIYRNNSTIGNISFLPKMNFEISSGPYGIAADDLDGDGRPDLAVALGGSTGGSTGKILVIKNLSSPGNILIAPPVPFNAVYLFPTNFGIADFDGNGQVDLAVNDQLGTMFTVLKNASATTFRNRMTCAGDSLLLTSSQAGSTHQWQVNYGSGYIDLADTAVFSGTNTATLKISKVYMAMDGLLFRSNTDNGPSIPSMLGVDSVAKPLVVLNNNVLSVSNADTNTLYTWSFQNSNGTWADLSPAVSSFTFTQSGNYRVRAVRGVCGQLSDVVNAVLASLQPVSGNELGIIAYPNPSNAAINFSNLKLSDMWETLEVASVEGRTVLTHMNVRNKTSVHISVSTLPPGVYIATLRRRNGSPATVKVVKY